MHTPGAARSLYDAIFHGDHDHELDRVLAAIRSRQRTLGERKAFSIAVGQIVTFNDKTHPTYLIGAQAKVIKVNKTSVTVKVTNEFQAQAGRFGADQFRCPVSLLV